MSNAGEILEWFNYDAIFNQGGENLSQIQSKYQSELNSDTKALFPDVLKGDRMAMFKLGEILSSIDIGENIKIKYYNISKYEYFCGIIKKIDRLKRKVVFQNLYEIKFDNIIEISRI